MKRKKERKKESIFQRKEVSEKIRNYFEERDQRTCGGKTETSEEGMETNETHLKGKERKKGRKKDSFD